MNRTVLLSLVVTLVMGWSSTGQAKAPDRPVLLVTHFDNHTGDDRYDSLGKGLADMLITDLAAHPAWVVVERERLQALLAEQDLQQSDRVEASTAVALGKLVGASHAITGSLIAIEPTLRIDIRLIDIATSKVLLTDHVEGTATKFFEMEQELARRFIAALEQPAQPLGAAGRLDLDGAMAYSDGLDRADRGDLEGASQALREVVTAQPDFKLGQDRYMEVTRRLYEARKRRAASLSELEQQLQERVNAEVKGWDANTWAHDRASRYLGYRVLQGNLHLRPLRDTLVEGEEDTPWPIAEGKQADALELARSYLANTQLYIGEMQAWRAAHPASDEPFLTGKILDEDAELAEAANLGQAGCYNFATPARVAADTAEFIFCGRPDFYGDINFEMTPTLATLDPAYVDVGFQLLDLALAEVEKLPQEDRADAGVHALHIYALAYKRLGRPAEAAARWQMLLDRYPTHEDYGEYEALLMGVLGID